MKKIILIALLCTFTLSAQENLTVSIGQDVKLALYENDHDLQPFTANPTIKARLNGKQFTSGFMTLGAYFEYADLSKKYRGYYVRYGVEGGYTFNKLRLLNVNFELTPYIGLGIVNREFIVKGNGTYHFGTEIALKLFKWLNLYSDLFMVKRSDLDSNELQPAFKLGLQFKVKL